MKPMLTTLLGAAAIMASAVVSPSAAMAQKGEKSVGLKVGYATKNDSFVTGLYFQYRFSSVFRLAPNIDYVFRHKDKDAFVINIDGHFPIDLAPGRASIYPLAGLSYTTCSYHNTEGADTDGSTRKKNFGLNLGAGFDYRVKPSLKLTVEAKYSLVKHFTGTYITLGIGYIF